ncbi:hypothetical protein FBU30_003665 [Linnemannia zychae]|nr:hypothetical protein FBU30_003665 [Linnemannia zychae]
MAMRARLKIENEGECNEKEKDREEEEQSRFLDQKQNVGSCGLFESIRTLNIHGNIVDISKMIEDLRPCFRYLKTLEIETQRPQWKEIDIFVILDASPALKSFTCRSSYIEIVHSESDGESKPLGQYPLKEFILTASWINIMTATKLVRSCPNLHVLKTLRIATDGFTVPKYPLSWETSVILHSSLHLTNLVRQHCPMLQCYHADFQYRYPLARNTRLCEMIMHFPQTRHLSMTSDEDIGPLSTIPFLQLPNRSLIPSQSLLFETDNERRRREQKERDVVRKAVLERDYDNSSFLFRYSGLMPRVWPCRHTLRQLECGSLSVFSNFNAFARQIRAYKLFGQLTILKVDNSVLNIGQRKSHLPLADNDPEGKRMDTPIDERFPNDFLPLIGLVYIEEFTMNVAGIRGWIHVHDFNFLQRKEADCEHRYLPPLPSIPPCSILPSLPKITHARKKKATAFKQSENDSGINTDGLMNSENDNEDNEDIEGSDSEDENNCGESEAYKNIKTFWPRLTIFHVNYGKRITKFDKHKLIYGLEKMRPGVEFRFQRSPHITEKF